MHLTHLFSTTPSETFSTLTNYTLRALFFALNLVFNLAMWSLFTTALTRATSTTRVSIVNTSANFFVTAVLGALVFGEKLPGMWWVGAALLAAGTVVVGAKVRRDGEGQKGKGRGEEGEGLMGMTGEEEEEGDMIDMDDGLGSGGGGGFADGETTRDAVRMGEEVDAPLR